MEQAGVKVEAEALKEYGQDLGVQIERLEAEIFELAGETFNINSPKQLGVVLLNTWSSLMERRRRQDIPQRQIFWKSWRRTIRSYQRFWNTGSWQS